MPLLGFYWLNNWL